MVSTEFEMLNIPIINFFGSKVTFRMNLQLNRIIRVFVLLKRSYFFHEKISSKIFHLTM